MTIRSQSMLSWRPCILMTLTLMCGLVMRTSTAITCTTSGQESRVNNTMFFWNNNQSCVSTSKVKNPELSLSGQYGTLSYGFLKRKENFTLFLDNISNVAEYRKIHVLTCENTTCGWTGKIRFGQSKIDGQLSTVFEYFQNSSFKQKCRCFLCHCDNCNESCPDFYCNCIFSKDSIGSAQPLVPRTTSTFTEPPTTKYSTSTTIDPVSAGRQSDGDNVGTLAAVGGTIALVVIISGVTVFVCLRRRQWNKKRSDYSEPCVTNASYEDLQDNNTTTGHDNAEYGGSRNNVHTYDLPDYQKPTTTGDKDYSYANFGGQSKFPDQKLPPLVPELKENPKSLFDTDVRSDDYDLAKAVAGDEGINSNSTTLPENYFITETTGRQPPPLRNNSNDNYFVLENDANERVEAMQTTKETFLPEGGNYFLVDESENVPVNEKSLNTDIPDILKTGNKGITSIQDDNYFLVEQQTNSEEDIKENGVYALAQSQSQENGVYALAQSQSQTKNGHCSSRKNKQITTDRVSDPYDHVRVGHVQTNGMDDGVYDELRKQNVRYESEEVDNDYDRCPATGHL